MAFQDISFDIKSNKPHLPGGDLSKSKNSLNSDSPLIHSNSLVNSVIVYSSLNSSMLVDSKIFQRDGDETDHSGIQPTSNKRCGSDPCDTVVGGSSYYDHPQKKTCRICGEKPPEFKSSSMSIHSSGLRKKLRKPSMCLGMQNVFSRCSLDSSP